MIMLVYTIHDEAMSFHMPEENSGGHMEKQEPQKVWVRHELDHPGTEQAGGGCAGSL